MRVVNISPLTRSPPRVRRVNELPSFFSNLLKIEGIEQLIFRKRRLITAKNLALIRVIERLESEDVVKPFVQEIDRELDEINLKLGIIVNEVPFLENDIALWKDEGIKLTDYIYNARINNTEVSTTIVDLLMQRLRGLILLKRSITNYLERVSRELDELHRGMEDLRLRESVGLISRNDFNLLSESLGNMIKNKEMDIECLKNFVSKLRLDEEATRNIRYLVENSVLPNNMVEALENP